MSQNLYLRRCHGSSANQNLCYPKYFKDPKEENMKMNASSSLNINKPPVSQREFGKELTTSTLNQQGFIPMERRNITGSNKLFNYFKPLKKEKEASKKKNDISLYNLRPRGLNSNKNSKCNSNNNSFSYNNENINTMNNSKVHIEKEIVRNKNNDMDVEMKTDKVTDFAYNTYVSTQVSNLTYRSNLVTDYFSNKEEPLRNNLVNKHPQHVSDYLDDIYEHLKSIEVNFLPQLGYMANQRDLNDKMRAILIDWLVEVHQKFKLVPETLFLTTQLIDRFLERREIDRNSLQLVGVAALFIACKYEEIYPPELKDFVYITDKAYSKNAILEMEKEIMSTLEFNITHPSTLRFLEIFIELSQVKFEEQTILFARYLLELFLIEYRMIKYPPSWIAAATLYITVRVKKLNSFNRKIDIPKLSGYSEEKLKECAKDICIILDNAERSSLQAVKNKYSSPKYFEVAKWKNN